MKMMSDNWKCWTMIENENDKQVLKMMSHNGEWLAIIESDEWWLAMTNDDWKWWMMIEKVGKCLKMLKIIEMKENTPQNQLLSHSWMRLKNTTFQKSGIIPLIYPEKNLLALVYFNSTPPKTIVFSKKNT